MRQLETDAGEHGELAAPDPEHPLGADLRRVFQADGEPAAAAGGGAEGG